MIQSEPNDVLYCRSCFRAEGNGPDQVEPVRCLDIYWCPRCARVGHTASGIAFVGHPSPGRMYPGESSDPLDAFDDCFQRNPKWRIRVDQARDEIRRAWSMWDGDRSESGSKVFFFGWLRKHRPYFLTFQCGGDQWQKVQSWLSEHQSSQPLG